MDKRKEENIRVKVCITQSLFRLMQTKSLSEITVTELVKDAGVARASFYRNYDSKEDVLVTLIRDVLELFRRNMSEGPEGLYAADNVLLSFRFFRKYRSYVLDLCRSGFALVILDELNRFHESVDGTMHFSSTAEIFDVHVHRRALQHGGYVAVRRKPGSRRGGRRIFFRKDAPNMTDSCPVRVL